MPHRRLAEAAALAGLALAALWLGLPFAARQTPEVRQIAVASLALELCLLLVAVALARLSRQSTRETLGLGPGRASGKALLLLAGGTVALSHGLDGVLELSGWRAHSSLADLEARLEGARRGDLALALIGIGLAPGIAEEVLCRGLVQRGLERLLPAGAAIGLAALFFGALHLDPIHAAFAAVLGLYLGAAAWLAASVRASILCHVLNNVAAVAAPALLGRTPLLGLPGTLAGFGLAGACLWAARRAVCSDGSRPASAEGARSEPKASEGGPPLGPALQREPGSDDR